MQWKLWLQNLKVGISLGTKAIWDFDILGSGVSYDDAKSKLKNKGKVAWSSNDSASQDRPLLLLSNNSCPSIQKNSCFLCMFMPTKFQSVPTFYNWITFFPTVQSPQTLRNMKIEYITTRECGFLTQKTVVHDVCVCVR
jgi:hypothetical protein